MTMAYIGGLDGVSNTALISENADAWTWPGPSTGSTYDALDFERYVGFAYNSTANVAGVDTASADPWTINKFFGESKATSSTPATDIGYMRPSAYHPSGVNMGFCDGKVKFISEDISYAVFQAIMTPRGSQSYNNTQASPPYTLYTPVTDGPTIIPSEDAIR